MDAEMSGTHGFQMRSLKSSATTADSDSPSGDTYDPLQHLITAYELELVRRGVYEHRQQRKLLIRIEQLEAEVDVLREKLDNP